MSNPEITKNFNVAIVGGGVCGLVCAVALIKHGVSVEVFEAAAKFEEIGAGVGFGPNAVRILDAIGVLDHVLAKSNEDAPVMRGFNFISGYEGHELMYGYQALPEDLGAGLHRALFLEGMVEHVPPNITHFNKRCTSISTSATGRPVVAFTDGTTHEADIVIGADGIKSVVRSAVVGDAPSKQAAFSNTVAYRGLVPIETLKAAGVKTDLSLRPVCFMGKDGHLILFPIKGGEIINIVAFRANHQIPIGSANLGPGESWVTPVAEEELMQQFEGWGSDVTALLGCLRSPNKWYIHVVYPLLETYVKGKVALLGDAAHGMLPHLGAGAGQGLEDGFVLAKLLGHPLTNTSNIDIVLQAYDHIRRPRSQMVWASSAAIGDVYDNYEPHSSTPDGVKEALKDRWSPVWHHDLDADIASAIKWLEEAGAFKHTQTD